MRVRALDHTCGADAPLWAQVVELRVASRDARFAEDVHRRFCIERQKELRELFRAGAEPGTSRSTSPAARFRAAAASW